MTQAWLDQRERGSVAGIRFMVGVALLLGRPIARALLFQVCLYFLLFSVKSRRASRKYLTLLASDDHTFPPYEPVPGRSRERKPS